MAEKINHHEVCDCIFCQSRCPECGSNIVEVEFSPTYCFKNNILNEIRPFIRHLSLVVTCEACGGRFTAGKVDEDDDPRIYELGDAINRELKVGRIVFSTGEHDLGIKPVGNFKKNRARKRKAHHA